MKIFSVLLEQLCKIAILWRPHQKIQSSPLVLSRCPWLLHFFPLFHQQHALHKSHFCRRFLRKAKRREREEYKTIRAFGQWLPRCSRKENVFQTISCSQKDNEIERTKRFQNHTSNQLHRKLWTFRPCILNILISPCQFLVCANQYFRFSWRISFSVHQRFLLLLHFRKDISISATAFPRI